MAKNYSTDKGKLAIWLTAAGVLLALLTVSGALTFLMSPITRLFLAGAAPLHGAGTAVHGWFVRLTGGCAPGEDWQVKYEEAKIEQAKLLSLATENAALKEAAGYAESGVTDLLTARVVFETGDDYSRRLVIDQGREAGLKVGQPVVAGAGMLIGKIIDVGRLTSSVQPITDSRSRLAVTVQNAQETMGVLEGERGLGLIITLIPQTEKLSPGDTVVTSGLEPGIRRGLVVGTIDKVTVSTQDPFQTASVRPFRSMTHPIFVQVIRSEIAGN